MLNGTTVQSWVLLRRGEMTTTGRFFTISGAVKPVLKSQIRSVPGFGWKVTMNVCSVRKTVPTRAVRLNVNRRLPRIAIVSWQGVTAQQSHGLGFGRQQEPVAVL